MNKYRNKKIRFKGIKFDSKKEANRYFELCLMQRAGEIYDLELQPKFEIITAINWNGKTLRKRFYIADFLYKQDEYTIVEDVKSPITAKNSTYTLKRQLFLIRYPEYIFREI